MYVNSDDRTEFERRSSPDQAAMQIDADGLAGVGEFLAFEFNNNVGCHPRATPRWRSKIWCLIGVHCFCGPGGLRFFSSDESPLMVKTWPWSQRYRASCCRLGASDQVNGMVCECRVRFALPQIRALSSGLPRDSPAAGARTGAARNLLPADRPEYNIASGYSVLHRAATGEQLMTLNLTKWPRWLSPQ